ncbi:MAG TPA: L-2-hydroxyglutarate oxidase [Burkholderiales bacterium]
MTTTADFLVIGGGVIGLNLALEAKRRYPGSRVVLIEKEDRCGAHASGRNSGVLHAGFYYTADSLKARFTREGNLRLTRYCEERGLRIRKCGKLVVARDERELAGLEELLRRGRRNGVEVHELTAREARAIEPRVRTYDKALWSPTTSSVDPAEVMESLVGDARAAGIDIRTATAFVERDAAGVVTTRGRIAAGCVINAAGLYADRIARAYGFSRDYRILPFKGLYLYSPEPDGALRTNVYPVPDLNHPFLGVHYTVAVDGKIKIGPTAVPAFWREHYAGWQNFRLAEFGEIVGRELAMFLRNDIGFRRLAWTELQKYFKRNMVRQADALLTGNPPASAWRWGKPGIRAQLVNTRERRLEMDFRYEGDRSSFHVLNAVSPAFTCSMPFAEFLFDRLEEGRLAA